MEVGRVLAYVENNPVRAGMVGCAEEFEWSSTRAHLGKGTAGPMLDTEWWQQRWNPQDWQAVLLSRESEPALRTIREATYTGRPLGSQQFVRGLEEKLGRILQVRSGGKKGRIADDTNQLHFWNAE
jgi:putative transposase